MKIQNRYQGALIDKNKPVSFCFNQKIYHGFKGDTLASALLANGVRLVGRSFKYHRPRGIFSAGSEEPNGLVTLREGADSEPNVRATVVELYDGLVARSQNFMGRLEWDFLAINDLISPLLGAGFYYKTFMWPAGFWEKIYEPLIRRAAGLGALSRQDDPDEYEKGFLHCDLLVIGSGPSGLMAALAAARSGLQIILAEEDYLFGGRLNAEQHAIDGKPARLWVREMMAELAAFDTVRLMKRTTVYGAYDHGIYGALERVSDHLREGTNKVRQILWRVYSKRAILAAGSIERSIAFGNNDRPGIMLAGAVRAYVNRWGVTPGQRITVFTNNDSGYQMARELHQKGVNIVALVDCRTVSSQTVPANIELYRGTCVRDTRGRMGLKSIILDTGRRIETDCLAVSGGWSPTVHLTCHQGGRPEWREDIVGFVPGDKLPAGMSVVGAAKGNMTLAACLKEGLATAAQLAEELGVRAYKTALPSTQDEKFATSNFLYVKNSRKHAWIDLQNDVTSEDIKLSHREGFRSVEHLKRYTTLGMATDQGKTSTMLGLALMAAIENKSISEIGTSIFRPPYSPLSLGALAGPDKAKNFRPTRLPPSHIWAAEQGAVFVEAGTWLRARWYPRKGETHWRQCVDREVRAVRKSVGICDVSTLGKIDIQGRDAALFLNRIYANDFAGLAVGKSRYGIMLREDGLVMDDGTTARLSENHFLMTTTTAGATSVFRHLEFCRQCLWPDMKVQLIPVSDHYAQYAISGPNSRKLLAEIIDRNCDISNESFPFMSCGEISVAGGVKGRLFRISFSGELGYELALPARYGDSLIRLLMKAGERYDVTPYGTEALNVLRIEKGHVSANEINGQTTAMNLGLAKMLSRRKDYIGNILSRREGLCQEDGLSLAGFKPINSQDKLKAGAHLLPVGCKSVASNDQGWISSAAFSPHLGCAIGLGFIRSGNKHTGKTVRAVDLLAKTDIPVEICNPHFIDPEGTRLRD